MAQEEKRPTKREKVERFKTILRDLLREKEYKWNDLLMVSTNAYVSAYEGEEHDIADIKGKFGSVFSEMEKAGEVAYDKPSDLCKWTAEKEKKRGRKKKETLSTAEKLVEKTDKPSVKTAKKSAKDKQVEKPSVEEKKETKKRPVAEKKEVDLGDVVFLGNAKKQEESKEKPTEEKEEKKEEKPVKEGKKTVKKETKPRAVKTAKGKKTEEELLKEAFLKRLRSLGGKYFEYYSVYLLERHAFKNGRRVEAFRISGGENDGGIDGELELCDKFGFYEVIYIQAKNWDDTKGGDKWKVKLTDFQQFVGAVQWRKVRDGKSKCRGIFITTSHFHEAVKEILQDMNDEFVAYDCDDVFETAKESQFGLLFKDGKWQLDEKLLSGEKAFFELF